jgi:hypothetical protein
MTMRKGHFDASYDKKKRTGKPERFLLSRHHQRIADIPGSARLM